MKTRLDIRLEVLGRELAGKLCRKRAVRDFGVFEEGEWENAKQGFRQVLTQHDAEYWQFFWDLAGREAAAEPPHGNR